MGNGLYYKFGIGAIEPLKDQPDVDRSIDVWLGMENAAGGYAHVSAPYEAEPDFLMVPLAYSTNVIVYHDDFSELQGQHVIALLKRTPDDFGADNRFAVQLDGIPPSVAELIGADTLEAAAGKWRAIQDYWQTLGVTLLDPVPILVNDWD